MHDPMTVAFEIPAPWWRRTHVRHRTGSRWGISALRSTHPDHLGERVYPWYRWKGYEIRAAGETIRAARLVTVWHVEPDGRDSGEVCPHGGSWRWHVHHWRLQVPALQALRRWALTRCEWCGGRSTKGHRANVSHQWDREPGPWWRGERGLFHTDCSSVEVAHRSCTCDEPITENNTGGKGWGRCARCSLFLGYGREPHITDVHRLLKTCPAGQQPSAALMAQVRHRVGHR